MKKLRILIADDHALVRLGARTLIETKTNWQIVGEASNGAEAVKNAKQLKPDVAIVDLTMPGLDGLGATRQIREALPDTKVVVLTFHDSSRMVHEAIDAGAHGFVLKADAAERLLTAVADVCQGRKSLTPKVSEIVLESFLRSRDCEARSRAEGIRPTPREAQIIRLLAEGKVNKEIALQLGISISTVETHRAKILHKLGLRSVASLVHYALRHGLVSS